MMSTPVNPAHYRSNGYGLEAIDIMRRTFGDEEVATFCRINAFKYRLRAGLKEGNPAEQDLAKEAWYLDKYHALSAAAADRS
jgi:hypothetical protein